MIRPVLIYRWTVFLLAAFYVNRMVLFGDFDGFGGPFRYLTIWALLGSFFVASRMLSLTEGRSARRWDGAVGAVAVLNAMVVFLYWRLYFADPTSVTQDGQLGAWWKEYYLHLLGPLLQWIDALVVRRSFRRFGASILTLFGVIGAYVLWIEGVVGPMNPTPSGSVTSGLPYRFLNNLPWDGRAGFYVTNIVVAVVLLCVFTALAWAIRRMFPTPEAHEARPGNPGISTPHPDRS